MACETPTIPDEIEVARRWWSLPTGCLLPVSDGTSYRLLFAGRRGGGAGPDVRDAVLSVLPAQPDAEMYYHGQQILVGDIEFHVQASAWWQHQHHTDARYNRVILHVVLLCDDATPTRCQAGTTIPLCSLYDLPAHMDCAESVDPWPCQSAMSQFSNERLSALLRQAGLLRFEEKAYAFVERLRSTSLHSPAFALYDVCLIPALAEALGYGRDREFFRAAGKRMVGLPAVLPEPLGRALQPAPLDARRLRVLGALVARWRVPGVWQTLRAALLADNATASIAGVERLRALFRTQDLSLARTDILLINVVLPFAVAVALQERDTLLQERAQALYECHPGLSSNQVTRMMCAQLRLPGEPIGSCQQQGLHYIYQQTCREKRCNICIVGRRVL